MVAGGIFSINVRAEARGDCRMHILDWQEYRKVHS